MFNAAGAEVNCGGFFQAQCTGPIPTRHLLFPDAQLPQNVFFEDIRLFHEATTNGSIHSPGPRRPDLLATPTGTNPNPMTGHTEPTAETFFKFNDDGTSLVPFQESLTDFWREYAYGGASRRVQGGEGPKYTVGSPTRNGQERDNIFANFRWEVSDDVTLNTRFTYGVTEGEQIRNAPRNNQMDMCIYTDVRQGQAAVTAPPGSGLTAVPATTFNPNVLFQPGTGTNQQSAGAQYDGNPAYAGHFFQIQVPVGAPGGTPNFVRHMGPGNGFLDPRAPYPIDAASRQILLDRTTTLTSAAAAPNGYSSCGVTSGGFYNLFQARQGFTLRKNVGEWLDRRILTDTDQMSLGFTADGPLLGGDKWTWDASLQFGTSDREQLRTDIQRNFRYMMALDSVYDPQANGGAGGVVCRANASAAAGGDGARDIYRNFILGLGSIDTHISDLGTTMNGNPVVVSPELLALGTLQTDLLREGCQPLNPFGRGFALGDAADEARQREAVAFAFTDQIETSTSDQLTASFSVSGEVWKGFGAGPVRMAAGFDYRDNSTRNFNESLGGGAAIVKSDFSTQFGDPWNGLTEAYEVFSEFELPLVRDRLGARYLSVNFTGRRTLNKTKRQPLTESTTFIDRGTEALDAQRYGTSWRASLNWSVTDWMRIRATKSADIRSPSSRELFSTITAQIGGLGFNSGFIRNPWRDPEGPGGGTTQNEDDYSVIRGSNETLGNELNGTKSLGIVVTPGGFAEGFSFSADYSELFVTGGITYLTGFFGEPGTEDEREEGLGFLPYPIYQCYTQNDPFWCDKVIFNPTGSVDEPNTDGLDPYTDCPNAEAPCVARTDIVAWVDTPFNAEPFWTRNLDLSASYNLQLDGGGSLSVRMLATRALEQSRCLQTVRTADGNSAMCAEGQRQNVVGVTGSSTGTQGFANFTSQPKWSGNVYASYSKQAFTITGQARYTGEGWQSLNAIGTEDPRWAPNTYNTWYAQKLPSWTTFNLTTSYNFARSRFAPERFENLQLSLTVDNLFDKQPDFYSCQNCTGGVNTRFYSGNGRTYRLNFRSAF